MCASLSCWPLRCVDGSSFCGQSSQARQSLSRAKAPSIATSAFFPLDAGFFLRDPCKLQPSSPAQTSTSARANSSTSFDDLTLIASPSTNSQPGLHSCTISNLHRCGSAVAQWILGFSPMHCQGTEPLPNWRLHSGQPRPARVPYREWGGGTITRETNKQTKSFFACGRLHSPALQPLSHPILPVQIPQAAERSLRPEPQLTPTPSPQPRILPPGWLWETWVLTFCLPAA